MLPVRIEGATRYLGAPLGWEPETQGPCGHLAIRDIMDPDIGPEMMSAWQPTPDELDALNAGASVILFVTGSAHPPVALVVGEPADGAPKASTTEAGEGSGMNPDSSPNPLPRMTKALEEAPSDEECEAAARLMAPRTWETFDSYLADVKRKYKGKNASYDPDAFKDKKTMRTAREVLTGFLNARSALGEPE